MIIHYYTKCNDNHIFAGFKMCSVYVLKLDQMVPNVASGVNLQYGSQKFHPKTAGKSPNPWDVTINERIGSN